MAIQSSRRVIARTIASKLVAEPARQEHWIRVLAAHLVASNRTHEVDLILNDLAHELHLQAGHLLVHITSAHALTDAVRTSLKRMLAQQTDATVVHLTEDIDPGLLGGIVAKTPDAQLDTSIRTKLNRLATIQ